MKYERFLCKGLLKRKVKYQSFRPPKAFWQWQEHWDTVSWLLLYTYRDISFPWNRKWSGLYRTSQIYPSFLDELFLAHQDWVLINKGNRWWPTPSWLVPEGIQKASLLIDNGRAISQQSHNYRKYECVNLFSYVLVC